MIVMPTMKCEPDPGRKIRRSRTVLLSVLAGQLAWSLAGQSQAQAAGYSGALLYKTYCASCHGARGHGDGTVASSMKVEVPDLTRISARQGGKFPTDQIRKIIDGRTTVPPHGTREMPVWGFAFQSLKSDDSQSEQHTQALVTC